MPQKYFAFYWTLPVPWAGFTSLPNDVDAAAAKSRTIWYSRERARTYVSARGGVLVPGGEVVQLELKPDRGSEEIAREFKRLLDRAAVEDARVVVVEFSGHRLWRGHEHLSKYHDHERCCVIRVTAGDAERAGFNPYENFEQWREATKRKISGKTEHRLRVLAALDEIEGDSFPAKAMALNELGERTHGGKPWTADNLRKFLS